MTKLPLSSIDYPPSLGTISTGANLPAFSERGVDSSLSLDNRLVVKESNLSLLVNEVRQTADQIITYAKDIGGYMVSVSYARPSESPFSSITIRVPVDKFDESLTYFRSLAVKVTSENLIGTDVTEEYKDIEASLTTLRRTQDKFNSLLDKAVSVQDILTIQRELINLQQQIDSLIGQKKAIEQNVQLTKITIYLSTDELALPYAPDKEFRPTLIFKQAVRSLVTTVRSGMEFLIWIGVYAVVWIPILLILLLYKRWKQKRTITIK